MNDVKTRMLRCIAQKPRAMIFFSEGNTAQTVSIRHLLKYAQELAADGLIYREDGLMHVTDEGIAEVNKPLELTPPRTICAATTKETYRTPRSYTREAGEEHRQYRSLQV